MFLPGMGILGIVFWISMIYDCARNEPERDRWLWILLMFNLPGSVVYFVARFLPRANFSDPRTLGRVSLIGRWLRQRELWNAESDARNIGTAHHWTVYGNVLSSVGMRKEATEAYERALEKDKVYPDALWGAAATALQLSDHQKARERFEALLALDPTHKYGRASLDYGRTLVALGDLPAARAQLEKHLQRWSHPEAMLLLAVLQKTQGETREARERLERMIRDVRGGPHYHFQTNKPLVRKAEKLLRAWAAEGRS